MEKQLITLTRKLISIPSYVDLENDESQIERYLYKYIKQNLQWLNIYRQKEEKNRYNLIAANTKNPSIVFICHIDTVKPSANEKITLLSKKKGNKLFGLGAVDMKGGIAAVLTALKETGETNNVALILDCDEEYYFKGIKEVLGRFSFNPKLVVCPEPTNLKIVNGCRGLIEIKFDVIGKTAHAGRPADGINAIEMAIKLVQKLSKELMKNDIPELGKTTVNLSSLNGGKLQNGKIVIQANTVADIAIVLVDIRPADPEMDAEKVVRKLELIARNFMIKIGSSNIRLNYKPYITRKSKLKICEEAIQKIDIKVRYRKNLGIGGFYESALIANSWNCPAISFGPSPANKAHKADEYVDIESLIKSKNIYSALINSWK